MLNFHRFAIDWLSLNFSECAEKASKRANKTGVFTRISMGQLFSGVRPENHRKCQAARMPLVLQIARNPHRSLSLASFTPSLQRHGA